MKTNHDKISIGARLPRTGAPEAALAVLAFALGACGSSVRQVTYTPTVAPNVPPDNTLAPLETKVDADGDNDVGAPNDDTSNDSEASFGHAASASEQKAITALIKRYYAAALAENGAKACRVIYSPLVEAVPEDYGKSPPGPRYMESQTCPGATTLLFRHFHAQLRAEVPRLKVTKVRLKQHHGLALLSFGRLAVRKILVIREGRTWKLAALLDGPLL
jgi:hypothetical protein